jgi:hypothetical protein
MRKLDQACELEAKLVEEYHTVRLLRASIAGEASTRGERARELGKLARDRINTDFDVENQSTPPRPSQKLIAAAALLRAMSAPSTPEAWNLHREVRALVEQAAVQQAESSASHIRHQGSTRDDKAAQGPEASIHDGGPTGQPANQGRTLVRERILDTRGHAKDDDARNVINAQRTGNAEARVVAGYHPRRGGRYDSREDRSPTPEPPGTVCSAGRSARRASRSASVSPHLSTSTQGRRTPVYGSTTTALACQLGGATIDEVIIRNLPLHLVDSAWTWFEHLPASQIHNWDDLVHTFVGNF